MATGKSPLPGPLSKAVAAIISDAIETGKQAAIARAAEISPSQLSRILASEKVFKLDELDRVCTAIGLDIVEVITSADAMSSTRISTDPAPNEPISLDDRRANVSGSTDDVDIPENVEEAWAGQYAAHPNDGEPEDHTP